LVQSLQEILFRPRRWPRAYVGLPFLVNSIIVKNNLRLFGCGEKQNLSVKLALSGLKRAGCLRREIKARRLLTETLRPSFGVPNMSRYDRQNGRWIAEDMVIQTKGGRPLAEEFIQDHALAFYRSTSRLHCVSGRKVHGLCVSEIIRYLPKRGCRLDLDNVLRAKWPIALCHGDLSPDNMMRNQQGKLFVADWEKACVMPVAADLRKIYTRCPQVRSDVLRTLGALCAPETNAVLPEIQMALVLAADIALSNRNRDVMVQYFMQARGMSARRARQHLENSIKKNEALIQELC